MRFWGATEAGALDRTISDAEWAGVNLLRDDFHGDWNYTIRPRAQS